MECPIGISQKTGTNPAWPSMSGTIPVTTTGTAESDCNSLDPANPSFCEQPQLMLCLSGENSLMTADNRALIAPSSATKAKSKARSLSDRLTQSLISAGLVKGITPTSVRRQLGAAIPDIVSWQQDGKNAE